ncbi:hypothetical protein HDV00_012834 [Rhizophlyctis rosea]|nr:hypothetical protein HDV00_012834 [Rhizophlyctis rosea]
MVGLTVYPTVLNWLSLGWYKQKSDSTQVTIPDATNAKTNPFAYLYRLYGKRQLNNILITLNPSLKRYPEQLRLLNDVLDTIHTAAILVDDTQDESTSRKGVKTAHEVFGVFPTINKAYTHIWSALIRLCREDPALLDDVLTGLFEIHVGQDEGLAWRRDNYLPTVADFVNNAEMKTGGIFRIVGRVALRNTSADDAMTALGLWAQLQNDYKNLWSDTAAKNKGIIAEDIENGERTFPIVYALNHLEPAKKALLLEALDLAAATKDSTIKFQALALIEEAGAREATLEYLAKIEEQYKGVIELWGRNEHKEQKS